MMSGTHEEQRIRLCRSTSRDASEHAATFAGWQLECLQLSAGSFDGIVSKIDFDNISLIREQTNRVLMKRGVASAGSIVISLPISAAGSARFGGRSLSGGAILLSSGTDLPELLSPQRIDVVSIKMSREWLSQRAFEMGYFRLAQRNFHQDIFTVSDTHIHGLAVMIETMFAESFERPEMLLFPQSRSAMQDMLIGRVLSVLAQSESVDLSEDTDRKKTADRATEIAFHDVSELRDIGSICRTLGVSRRHLQNCFLSSYGESATHVLRAIRLNMVRNELKENALAARPLSIGDIAARWGFWHWSRFTAEYRDHFGELPSAIMRARRS